MNKNFVPLQQLPNGQWLATFCLYHRNVFTDEVRPRHHQVQFTNKPTVEMLSAGFAHSYWLIRMNLNSM